MLLKKIKLENIRSYLNEEIIFPEGSVLLSGNIGCGKSTILLAIDFVLFGLTRNILTGPALLRNGKDKGSVELHFLINEKNIIIKRSLKRTSDSVVQDTGFIIVNDIKKDLSATELKQFILDILNYPKELLTKSKSLIYRYTVYTPQEEMKQILLGDKDIRLDTLRKVFGIDKYKRIIENTQIFISKLKEKRKEFLGRIEDLERKKAEKESKIRRSREIEEQKQALQPIISKLKRSLSNKQLELVKFEQNIKLYNEIKKDLEFTDSQIKEKERKVEQTTNQITENKEKLDRLYSELQTIKELDQLKLDKLKSEIESLERRDKEIIAKLSEFNSKIQESKKLMQKILELENCPTCKQKVNDEHKKHIREIEYAKIKQLEESSQLYKNNQEDIQKKLPNLKQDLEDMKKIEQEIKLNKLKKENFNEKKLFLENLTQEKNKLDQEINNLKIKKETLQIRLNDLKDVEEQYKKLKKDFEYLQENLKKEEIKEATLLKEKQDIELQIDQLTKEILDKLKIKENISHLIKIQEYLQGNFTELMKTMEKQIMLRVHNDFNELFKKWFDILIENENLQVNLDQEFSPKIQQAGYDIDYLHLSGGEKTAAALSYRLALNQVINNLMSDIKTRDLLILDEPTDGFSDEQLDRMKLVLDELNIKQVVIVSHESKIESFVDNVIKLEKVEHVSKVN